MQKKGNPVANAMALHIFFTDSLRLDQSTMISAITYASLTVCYINKLSFVIYIGFYHSVPVDNKELYDPNIKF